MIATVITGKRRVGMLSFSGSTAGGWHTPRPVRGGIACYAALCVLAGRGGSGPKTDAEAVTQTLKDAVGAVANRDGDKACGYLTPDAQRQAALQVGNGVLGSVSCPALVEQATAFLTPLDKQQIKDLQPSDVRVSGTSASATMATSAGAPQGSGISVQLNLAKIGGDWKISGFQNAVGLPGS